MQAQEVKIILASAYYDPRHAQFVAQNTGAKVVPLANQVGARADTDDYISMVDYNVRQLAAPWHSSASGTEPDKHPLAVRSIHSRKEQAVCLMSTCRQRTTQATPGVDWHRWLQRWDVQQTGYLPDREGRFTAMLDVLEILLPDEFVALDLACGPGAISQRLLARFPKARCVAVDLDPVLLTMGQSVLGTMGGRLRWVAADLTTPEWITQLGETQLMRC